MCKNSDRLEHLSRKAVVGELLVIRSVKGRRLPAPLLKEARILCVCLKTGDRVQFTNLPAEFLNKHPGLIPNPIATFIEGANPHLQPILARTDKDRFDFGNEVEVALDDFFKGIHLKVLTVAADNNRGGTGSEFELQNFALEEELVPVLATPSLARPASPNRHFSRPAGTRRRFLNQRLAGLTGALVIAACVLFR